MNSTLLAATLGVAVAATYFIGLEDGKNDQSRFAYEKGLLDQKKVDEKDFSDREEVMRRSGVCVWAHLMANCPLPKGETEHDTHR